MLIEMNERTNEQCRSFISSRSANLIDGRQLRSSAFYQSSAGQDGTAFLEIRPDGTGQKTAGRGTGRDGTMCIHNFVPPIISWFVFRTTDSHFSYASYIYEWMAKRDEIDVKLARRS